MRIALGERGAQWIAVGIAISTLGFLSQGMLTAPRVYYAMARDGLFFERVGRLSPRTGAPVFAIVLQGIAATVIACSGKYGEILNFEVTVDFISFGMTAAALFVFRRRAGGRRGHLSRAGASRIRPRFRARMRRDRRQRDRGRARQQRDRTRHPAGGRPRILVLVPPMRHKHSEYMHWAKTQSRARYNLATSGVGAFPMKELPFDPGTLEINGENSYGYRPLVAAIAGQTRGRSRLRRGGGGTSMANHLAMAAILEPGDEVLIEHPAYGLIVDAALYLGADVKRFQRTEESGYAVDPAEIRRALTSKTRLIVITNLHNPSSALTPDAVLREVGDLARSVGALVLVDEVYLDAVYENTPRTSFHLGPEFVVTSSLTKIYGVSGLRCGWILARPELAWKMRRLNDLFAATPAHPGELLSVAAFEHLDLLRERARRVVEADRAVLARFFPAPHVGHDVFSAGRGAGTSSQSGCGRNMRRRSFRGGFSGCRTTCGSGWAWTARCSRRGCGGSRSVVPRKADGTRRIHQTNRAAGDPVGDDQGAGRRRPGAGADARTSGRSSWGRSRPCRRRSRKTKSWSSRSRAAPSASALWRSSRRHAIWRCSAARTRSATSRV